MDYHGPRSCRTVWKRRSCAATALLATATAARLWHANYTRAARAAIVAGEAESKKNGWNHVFAVVDGGGTLIAFEKADLASNSSSEIAQAKARTAATFRVPTKAYQDRLSSGETFILGLPGVVPAAGGVPIVVGGKVIGAIGVSGATPLQDHQSAEAGAAAVK